MILKRLHVIVAVSFSHFYLQTPTGRTGRYLICSRKFAACCERQNSNWSAGTTPDLDRLNDELEPFGRQSRTVQSDVLEIEQVGFGQHAMRVKSLGTSRVHAGSVHAHAVNFAGVDDPLRRVLGYSRKPLRGTSKNNKNNNDD